METFKGMTKMRYRYLILTMAVLLVTGGTPLVWAAEEDEASTMITVTLPAFRKIDTMPIFSTLEFGASDLDVGHKESSAETLIVSADASWKLQARVDSTDSFEIKVKHNSNDFSKNLTTIYADIPCASGTAGSNQSSAITVKALNTPYSNQQQTLYVKIVNQD